MRPRIQQIAQTLVRMASSIVRLSGRCRDGRSLRRYGCMMANVSSGKIRNPNPSAREQKDLHFSKKRFLMACVRRWLITSCYFGAGALTASPIECDVSRDADNGFSSQSPIWLDILESDTLNYQKSP